MLDVTLENDDGEKVQYDRVEYASETNDEEHIEVFYKPLGHEVSRSEYFNSERWRIVNVYSDELEDEY